MPISDRRRVLVARSEVRAAVGGLRRTEVTSQEDLQTLDPLADARGPEATVLAAEALAVGASTAVTVLGPGGPAPASLYTRNETSAVVTARGVVTSIDLWVRHRLDGCSKLCLSPIGAILVIGSCSLLFCVAQVFSPPPFGINTGRY